MSSSSHGSARAWAGPGAEAAIVSTATARFVHAAMAVVAAGGAVYGWMVYFAEPADEFALVNHPWQPELRSLHILAAPVALFACALIWRAHVWERIRSGFRPRRRTGLCLAVLFFPMVLSGYLLQISTGETLRTIWTWTHALTGSVWGLVYVGHLLSPARRERRSA